MKRNCKAKFFALLNSSICHDVRQRIDLSLLRRWQGASKGVFLSTFSALEKVEESSGGDTPEREIIKDIAFKLKSRAGL